MKINLGETFLLNQIQHNQMTLVRALLFEEVLNTVDLIFRVLPDILWTISSKVPG